MGDKDNFLQLPSISRHSLGDDISKLICYDIFVKPYLIQVQAAPGPKTPNILQDNLCFSLLLIYEYLRLLYHILSFIPKN